MTIPEVAEAIVDTTERLLEAERAAMTANKTNGLPRSQRFIDGVDDD